MDILFLFSCLPLFVLLIDGYYQKKLNASILLILLFVAVLIVSFILLRTLGLSFALAVPAVLFAILAVSVLVKMPTKRQK
ncbi:MAG: hypothetical protein AAF489_06505 [Bacteroidota bacterium]